MKNITLNIIGLILSREGSIVFIIDAEDSTSTRYPVIFLRTGR
jgi:hypothetical protein